MTNKRYAARPMHQDRGEAPYERARETVNPDRLLPGEDLAMGTGTDARHWARIYRELIAAKDALTACISGDLETRSPEARRELEEFDLTIIKAQQERFVRRLAYWETRAASG